MIIPKTPEVTRVDNCPTKRFNVTKGSTFNTLPMEILSTIYYWINILEYNDKHVATIKQIKSLKIPLFEKLAYMHLKTYHDF